MRALDDIRDRDYDRRYNPDRPLARGAVRVGDLAVLVAAGSALALVLNAWRWPVMCVLAGQLGYALLVIWVDRRWQWPPGDAMLTGLLVNLPVQLLINAYLYAALLHSMDLPPSWSGVAGIAVVTLAFQHVEFARKTTRTPRAGERTYVTRLGVGGTATAAVACAVVATALVVAAARPWHWTVLLTLLPLGIPAAAAWRLHRDRLPRWPYRSAALFVLTSF
ncbi:MAG TPA: UbiA family prenyltransferase, partial [Actinophytocola sp.]